MKVTVEFSDQSNFQTSRTFRPVELSDQKRSEILELTGERKKGPAIRRLMGNSAAAAALKQCIAPYGLDPAAHLAEPVRFEVLRAARTGEARCPEAQFNTLPLLPTPVDLWQKAIELGQAGPGLVEASSAAACWWPSSPSTTTPCG